MPDLLEAALHNLATPMVLSFALGVLAGALRSDLELPEAMTRGLSIYLLFSIGFRGGTELAEAGVDGVVPALLTAILLSALLPLPAYGIVRAVGGADRLTASAISAHYGSISIVTFVAATELVTARGLVVEGQLSAMAALMETPAIVTGLWLAGRARGTSAESTARGSERTRRSRKAVLREVLVHGSVVLLLGSFVIGAVTGHEGREALDPFVRAPFKGVLCLFLLDMGLLVARRFDRQRVPVRLLATGLIVPLVSATAGLAASWLLGLSVGGATVLVTLTASASYIAVPAAMRLAIPEVTPSIYVTLALGVTFPFNLVLGIPLYHALAERLLG
jgi:hypothetical protein